MFLEISFVDNKITIKDAKQRTIEVFRSSSNRPREIQQLLSLCDEEKVVGEFIVTQLYNRVMRYVRAWQPGKDIITIEDLCDPEKNPVPIMNLVNPWRSCFHSNTYGRKLLKEIDDVIEYKGRAEVLIKDFKLLAKKV